METIRTFLAAALLLLPAVGRADDDAPANAVEREVVERLQKCGALLIGSGGSGVRESITSVVIQDASRMTDEDFQALGRLSSVKTLQISGETLNDRTLGFLTGMSALEDLQTNQAQFTDAGLAQFAKFPNLKQIKFFHTSLKRRDFNGSGLAALAELKSLRRLTVAGCPFDDEGMAAVGRLTQLDGFRTWHTYQTEAGNASLKSLTNLKSLHLGQRLRRYDGSSNAVSLTPATLAVLCELTSLDTLHLAEARFTDDDLTRLKSLPNLKRLELDRVDISADEVERLKESLPGVTVVWEPLDDADRAALERLLKP